MVKAHPAPAPGESTSVALSLVNTRIDGPHGVVELIDDSAALEEWLRRVLSIDVDASTADLHTAHELRRAVRTLFTAASRTEQWDVAAIAIVNSVAATDPGAPRLEPRAGRAVSAWGGSGSNGVSAALARAARDAMSVLTTGPPLRECAAADCDRMFLSDHGRRIWCSATCGNRVRGVRHYARHSA